MDNRLIAYAPSRREIDGEERTFRTRVGVAFPHKRSDGYTILIDDNLSIRGEIVLFPPFDDARSGRPERSSRPVGRHARGPATASTTSTTTFRSSGVLPSSAPPARPRVPPLRADASRRLLSLPATAPRSPIPRAKPPFDSPAPS